MHTQDCRSLIAQYLRDLEAQLQRRDVRQEVERLRETYEVFKKYDSFEELATLVRPGNRAYADKDAVLGMLVARIQMDRQRTLFTLLNLIFWDSLMSIFRRKRRDCPNPADLFSRIQVEFFQVAVTYPLDRRPRKVNMSLYRDTWRKVTTWQGEEARYREQYKPLEPTHEHGMVPADVQESEVFPEEMERYLLDFLHRQVIDEDEYGLLLETAVYKRMTQKEWAEAHDVEYATARSWHHRAEQAIQEYAKAARERREEEALD